MKLAEFREQLQQRMGQQNDLRPFVCDGSPLQCTVFIVGFNPATVLDKPFWTHWSDATGYNKQSFMGEYLTKRSLQGVRPRIERIVAQFPPKTVLETNICSKPTKTAAELRNNDRVTTIFRWLLETIKPKLVYAHSDEPIAYFEDLTGCRGFDERIPRLATHGSHTFSLIATRGPLYRMRYSDAERLGRSLSTWMNAST